MNCNTHISLFAIFFTLLVAFTANANEQTFDREIDFEIMLADNIQSVRITKYIGNKRIVNIPPQIKEKNVAIIGQGAFEQVGLKSVTIPNSVTTIESSAFWSNQITNVIIPNSVTTIGEAAFARNELKNFTIPEGITDIADKTFASNQLSNVIIPNSVTSIGSWAFCDNQLTNVIIPNSVTIIGEEAFYKNQLKSITIGANVTLGGERWAAWGGTIKISSFDCCFDKAYKKNKRRAGTYILNDKGKWVWQKENSK